jgi:hypothetical protein
MSGMVSLTSFLFLMGLFLMGLIHTDFESRDKLAQRNEQKIEVEEKLELFVKHHRDEADDRILLIACDVGRILCRS